MGHVAYIRQKITTEKFGKPEPRGISERTCENCIEMYFKEAGSEDAGSNNRAQKRDERCALLYAVMNHKVQGVS